MSKLILLLTLATVAFAQAPSDTLVTKLAERDTPQKKFLRENPGATEVRRIEEATHYKNADGTFTAILGSGLNYVDADSQMQPVAPELWQTDAGFRQIGTPTPVRIVTTSRNQDTIEIWNGTQVASVTTSKLTKTGDFTWTFPWSMITWTLEVQPAGWQITSEPIASARGPRTYQMPLASSGLNPIPDVDGNLVDGTLKITRAVMVRADGVQTPCSDWTVGSKSVDFTCDDMGFPAKAFPYVIDPAATFNPNTGGIQFATSTATSTDWSYRYWGPPAGSCPTSLGTPTWSTWSTSKYWQTYAGDHYSFQPDYPERGDPDFDLWNYDCSVGQSRPWLRFDTSSLAVKPTSAAINFYVELKRNDGYLSSMTWVYPVETTPVWTSTSPIIATGSAAGAAVGWNAFPLTLTNDRFRYGAGALTVLYGGTVWADDPGSSAPSDFGDVYGSNESYLLIRGSSSAQAPYLSATYTLPNNAPTTVSATPNSGSIVAGTWQTFTFSVSDADGYGNLNYYHLLLAYGVDGVNSCYLIVYPNSNTLSLINNESTTWLGGYTFGSANTIENSQCKLDYAASTLTNSGTTSTAAVKIQPKPFSYGGWVKHSYVYVVDAAGAAAGWTDYGSWTLIPGGPKLIVVQQ